METDLTQTTQTNPVTKEDERKALAKIRKIVDALGTNSYVGTAFNGAWSIAEQNIDFDFGCSTMDLVVAVNKHAEVCEQKNKEIARIEKEIVRLKEGWEQQRNVNAEIEKCSMENYKQTLADRETIAPLKADIETLETKVKSQESELTKLKAKLYDYMVKE